MNRTSVLAIALVLTCIAPGHAADRRARLREKKLVTSALAPRATTATAETVAIVTVDAGNPFGIRLNGTHVTSAVTLYTVPQGQAFVLTGLDGSYACMCDTCRLYDASGLRLAWRPSTGFQRSYVDGVRFGPGTTIMFEPPPVTACPEYFPYPTPDPDIFNGNVAFMGRLCSEP